MIIRQSFYFPFADSDRTLHIYLPESYDSTEERYPVTYFFDGHNLFFDSDATFGKSWGMKEFLDGWEKSMIVVGLECSHKGNQRLEEYSPYHIVNDFFGDLHGTGEETMRWLVERVKPYIDRTFRTIPFRETTAIGGSSMGGLMSLYAALHFNRFFSKAACLSSSIMSCMDDLRQEIAMADINPDTRIYLSWGGREGGKRLENCNCALAQELKAQNAIVRVHMQKNGGHNETCWRKQMDRFMGFLWLDR